MFRDFDLDNSGYLTINEIAAMLIKLDFPIQRKYLLSIFRKFDSNNSGYIEFEEFVNYIINDPYP